MFLMKASEKVTTLNAYVTGYGASKRVVVWDNSISKATPDEISFIFGHEMGHYVLNHIPATLVFLGVLLLIEFYVGYRGIRWLISAIWGLLEDSYAERLGSSGGSAARAGRAFISSASRSYERLIAGCMSMRRTCTGRRRSMASSKTRRRLHSSPFSCWERCR